MIAAMGADGVEAVGEAVTGGLAARALELEAGEGDGAAEGRCLNCGTELIGPHCHVCGQSALVHRSIAAWWHDLAHGVLHLDGKVWRTLPLLAWRPGELTRRYIHGERAKFVSPLALFLFSVFLMFALFSVIGAAPVGVGDGQAPREIAAELDQAKRKVDTLKAERQAKAARGETDAALDERIAEATRERDALAATDKYVTGDKPIGLEFATGWPRLDQGIRKANANPALLFYKLQNNAYKFSWALIPISVPFLWLLFLHRRRYRQSYRAYDHLIFVTYSIAFMSLALIAIILLRSIGLAGGIWNLAIILIPPLHIYRQLRGAYALSRWSAIWRTFVLLIFTTWAITIFFLLLLALGVLA
jgi:hypothetical protein